MANNMDPSWGDSYGVPQGPAPKQRLTGAAMGFPVPATPGARQDNLNGVAHSLGTRHAAAAEAREIVSNDKLAIILQEAVAGGVRRGLRTSGGLSVDPNLINGNTRARPVNISGKFVIVPSNPTAAQTAAAALLAKANFAPGAYPTFPFTDTHNEDFQTGIVTGSGQTVKVKIRPSEVLIIDTLGITTFSPAAEYELVWLLTYGLVQAAGAAPNAANLLIPARRGWPFGSVDNPAVLEGISRLAPSSGPTKSGETDVYLNAQFLPAAPSTGGSYTPWPHYVEISLRGWKVQIGHDGLAMGTNVGGPINDANGGF